MRMALPSLIITDNGFPIIERIIRKADEYIYIASFLFYDNKLRELLIKKCKSSRVFIEVLTTPPKAAESSNLKEVATQIQTSLKNAGVKVIPCDWEVGRPELTVSTRAGGRIPTWFAMHAKFLVTDKHGLITSADINPGFSVGGDWNAYITYSDRNRILELRQKYERLRDFFSNVPSYIGNEYIDRISDRNLIRGYPFTKLERPLQEGFYLLPHDIYGRKIVERAINDSEEFIYCAFETIYDDELTRLIIKKLVHFPRLDFRVISSPLETYVQNRAKVRAAFLQMASYGAKIRILENLRTKMMVTDKVVISGSFDLAKMGIGFPRSIKKGVKAWVGSTEIMDVNTSKEYIEDAKIQFLELYSKATEKYGSWFEKDATEILRSAGAKRIAKDAKEMLGCLIFNEGRKSSERIKRISSIAVEIAKLQNLDNPYVKAEDIQRAEQILIMQERDELTVENVCGILGVSDAEPFLKKLRN